MKIILSDNGKQRLRQSPFMLSDIVDRSPLIAPFTAN